MLGFTQGFQRFSLRYATRKFLEDLGDFVRNLGRFQHVSDWFDRAPVRSHLLFYFAERQPGSSIAALQGWGPTPGAHVAPKIRMDNPAPFESPGYQQVMRSAFTQSGF